MVYGFTPTEFDGTEQKFSIVPNMKIPKAYSYVPFLSPILDQGEESICVPCSISAHLNWNKNVDTNSNNTKDNNVNLHEIYGIRSNKNPGMTFKEALSYLLHHGVSSSNGLMKIRRYAFVPNADALKQALIMNGPCIGAFMVYNQGPYFWRTGPNCYGGHAISIVGWTEEGFIIRNSWGSSWAKNGYTILPYNEFNCLLEAWTIMD